MDILALITLVLKFAWMIFEKTAKTKQEERSASLAAISAALDKARSSKDLSDLSKRLSVGV